MKIRLIEPPREFGTGRGQPIAIKDCARIALDANEQVTFVTDSGAEYDVTRKGWGFYATPSINGRLLNFGLRAALVKSYVNKYYLFLVERGKEAELEAYLRPEKNRVVRWLDNDDDLRAVESEVEGTAGGQGLSVHCMCGADRFTTVHMYFERPAGEVALAAPDGRPYRREVFRCSVCGHFVSIHAMLGEAFYETAYNDATYGDDDGMRRTFERIAALPPERSDNVGRTARVRAFAAGHFVGDAPRSILDVGSGLCVFLNAMKASGWRCVALDPDPRAARHAREVVGVEGVCADFLKATDLGRFDVVSFNKVLEHVPDPVAMLRRARELVRDEGFVYVELPDGEQAARDGYHREEFFIEHFHVFSATSIALLADRAGFDVRAIERLREPSTKYTLRAFLVPRVGQT